jgi:TrmH family RNA methyltransferase
MISWTKAKAKHITQLHQKKFRTQYQQFLVEGPKLVEEALFQNRFPVHSIIGTEEFFDLLSPEAKNMAFYPVSAREVKKISTLKNPQGGLAVLEMNNDEQIPSGAFLLYLDALQNPGNLGAIFRSAEWFGVDGILLGKGTVDPFNPKVVQSSMGSMLRVPFADYSAIQVDKVLKDYYWIGADMQGTPIHAIEPKENTILVIGNEGRGLTADTVNIIQERVSIPQHPQGKAESLNAALSASIIMYAWTSKKNSPLIP